MLLVISILIVLGYTAYLICKIYFNTDKLTGTTGMIIVMSLGMVSSLVIGLISGIVYHNNLTTSTMIAVISSLIVGYFLGNKLGLLVTIEGMVASLMGSMMGAMLGVMLPSGKYQIMLVFMDFLYIIVASLIFLLISNIVRKSSDKAPTIINSYTLISMMAILSVIVLIAAFYNGNYVRKQIDDRPVESKMYEHSHH